MTSRVIYLFILSLLIALPASLEAKTVKVFILSGQSNMAGLKPEISFTPTVEKEYGKITPD